MERFLVQVRHTSPSSPRPDCLLPRALLSAPHLLCSSSPLLVQVALAMQPAVFVPTERPPPLRLYIITEGMALYRGKKLTKGSSWGAEDVMTYSRKPEM